MDTIDLYNKAISTWGPEKQINMAIEEMSELTKELCKSMRGRDNKEKIAEEIADVEITLAQLRLIYRCHRIVEDYKTAKFKRLEFKLENEAGGES